MIIAFTCLSILLACLGLVGLVSYSTELKTKEIAMLSVSAQTLRAARKKPAEALKFE